MPISSRCPTCSAAVPQGAAWCSLCHADLRPRPAAPVSTVVPTVTVAAGAEPEPGELAVLAKLGMADAGRSSRVTTAPRSGGGRHAKEPVGKRERRAPELDLDALDLDELDLPDGEATPEQVDAIADQMLLRLAVSEPKQRFLDPDELPGGKWALAALGTVIVVSLLMLVYTVLGFILGG